MLFSPFFNQSANPCREPAIKQIKVSNVYNCSIVIVLHMKMRRVVLIKIHADDNA